MAVYFVSLSSVFLRFYCMYHLRTEVPTLISVIQELGFLNLTYLWVDGHIVAWGNFYILSDSLFINYLTIQCCTFWAADRMMMCCNTGVTIALSFYTGKFVCLVELSVQPTAVCYGSGQTKEEAKASAALNALEYLHIMTKKWMSKQSRQWQYGSLHMGQNCVTIILNFWLNILCSQLSVVFPLYLYDLVGCTFSFDIKNSTSCPQFINI